VVLAARPVSVELKLPVVPAAVTFEFEVVGLDVVA